MKLHASICLAVALATTHAQPSSNDCIRIYEDGQFAGQSTDLCTPGTPIMPIVGGSISYDNFVSSVIPGDNVGQVTYFDGTNFEGTALPITGIVDRMNAFGFNDLTSSIHFNWLTLPGDRVPSENCVIVFGGGNSSVIDKVTEFCFNVPDLESFDFDNQLRLIIPGPGVGSIELYSNANFAGEQFNVDASEFDEFDTDVLNFDVSSFTIGLPSTPPPSAEPTLLPSPVPTALPTTPPPTAFPTLLPCLEDEGNLEVRFPPVLDEVNTHLWFNGSDADMRVRILVPRQYLTAAFDFEGATDPSAAYNSEDLGANVYWTADTTSDDCNIAYTATIPWDLFRTNLGGINERRFTREVIYDTVINIEVTRELTITPETLLELGEEERSVVLQQVPSQTFTRVVTLKIPFEVRFDLELELTGEINVRSDDLRLTAFIVESSVLSVDPDADPFSVQAKLEFATIIPFPLYLDSASITVDNPGLRRGINIIELEQKSVCSNPDEDGFCVQQWRVAHYPEVCTLDGQYTATVHAACHPNVDNCLPPNPNTTTIVMDITSDNFCGVTQEVEIEGILTLDDTECNADMVGTVTVSSPEGAAINTTEIVEVRASPALFNSSVLTVHESGFASILEYDAALLQPNEVQFSFLWAGSQLRCDVEATVEVIVRVEYDATRSVLLSVGKDGAKLLQNSNDLVFASRVNIAPPASSNGNGGGLIADSSAVSLSSMSSGCTMLLALTVVLSVSF